MNSLKVEAGHEAKMREEEKNTGEEAVGLGSKVGNSTMEAEVMDSTRGRKYHQALKALLATWSPIISNSVSKTTATSTCTK